LHELSITQGILDIALDAARNAGLTRVTAIRLVVGDLASVVDDSVQFYFDILSKGTAAEGASLSFERRPATLACGECGHTFTTRPPLMPTCPACGAARLRVTGGRELRVESIEADGQETE
jgi:hydrogenase nickel incorporation protein HypA/HybF